MAVGFIRVPDDSANTGKYVDQSELTVNAKTVERQCIVQADPTTAAALAAVKNAVPGSGDYGGVVRNLPSDGTNAILSGSAANVAAQTSVNSQLVSEPGQWAEKHAPAANTQATASRAAGGAGVRHICTGISARICGGTSAPSAIAATLNLRDGATGAGTILASWTMVLAAAVGAKDEVNLTGLKVAGSAATALTLEFVSAGGANTFESVNLFGHDCV